MLGLVDPLRKMRSPLIRYSWATSIRPSPKPWTWCCSSVQREAILADFTASVAVALAMGHALAVALMESRGFRLDLASMPADNSAAACAS